MPYVVRQPIRLESCANMSAAGMAGAPQAIDTERKAVYIAPICAAPEAKR